MHTPTTDHWIFVKRLLRYLCGTVNEGIQLYRDLPLQLHAFSDHIHSDIPVHLQAFSDAN